MSAAPTRCLDKIIDMAAQCAAAPKTGHVRDGKGVCSSRRQAVRKHERRRARMDGAKWARHKQYTYDCRIARGASKDPAMTEEQRERLHEAYERHRAGEMTKEEFEAWCSGFWIGKRK